MALMRRARLVASVAGTACLEAAVLGIPAITFGKIFFSPILLRDGLDPYGLSHADMAALLAEADAWREHPDRDRRIEDFCTWSIAQSVEGVVGGDARENVPNLAANIDRIAAASTRLVRQNSPMMHEAVA